MEEKLQRALKEIEYFKNEQKKSENTKHEYHWKTLPNKSNCCSGKVGKLLSTFAFERDLERAHCVEEKLRILLHNRELLIFNLPFQLSCFKNWWIRNYNIGNARIQCENEEICQTSARHQHKLTIPLLEENEDDDQHTLTHIDNPSFDVAELTGICDDLWNIIFDYLLDDKQYLSGWKVCRHCRKFGSVLFLTSAFPFVTRTIIDKTPYDKYCSLCTLFCSSNCAWKFMVDKLPYYHSLGGMDYFLVPCVHMTEIINQKYSNQQTVSILLPLAKPPFLLTNACVVHDHSLLFPNDYEYFISQQIYSLVHQPSCMGNGCWTYLPKQLVS